MKQATSGFLSYNSVENIPGLNARAAFHADSAAVFREDGDIAPVQLGGGLQYIPWGADNDMPFEILHLIESDETLSTCQIFNAEVCYGSGLLYNTSACKGSVKREVEDFALENDLPAYFLGCCQDFKHFGFCVSVIILNADGTRIIRLLRKEACYIRFAPADRNGDIPYILYANWRRVLAGANEVERIELLDVHAPWRDLATRLGRLASPQDGKSRVGTSTRKFAIVSRVPTPDSTYYPIPYYAALLKGKWYNIKTLIGLAKEAKLKNSAPIKYHIEISNKYWESIFKSEGITDRRKQQ